MARVEGQRMPAMRIRAIRIGMKARNARRPMDMRPPLQVFMLNMSRPHIFAPHAAVTFPKPGGMASCRITVVTLPHGRGPTGAPSGSPGKGLDHTAFSNRPRSSSKPPGRPGVCPKIPPVPAAGAPWAAPGPAQGPAIPAGPDRSGPHGKAAARHKVRRRSFSVIFSGFRPPVPRCARP